MPRRLLREVQRERPSLPSHSRIEATEEFEVEEAWRSSYTPPPKEIVFTRGTTESINLVRFAWAEEHVKKETRYFLP